MMKIGVCVKQVPAKDAPLAIVEGGAWIRESDIGFETNEPDSYALEEALRLKEKHGGEVVAISMGPERAKQTIKEALAKGADRGIHVSDDQFYKLDPLGSARSMAAALKAENFDLILTGLQSDDQGFGQTGVLLAELLGRPHATIIMAIEVTDSRMKLKRELEAGWFQWVELPLPAVLSIQSGINKPRYATLKGIMGAKKKEITTGQRAPFGVHDAPTRHGERTRAAPKTPPGRNFPGPPSGNRNHEAGTRPVTAHIPSSRFCSQARCLDGQGHDWRLHRLSLRERQTHLRAPNVSRPHRSRRRIRRRPTVDRIISSQRLSRRPRHETCRRESAGETCQRRSKTRANPHQATRSVPRSQASRRLNPSPHPRLHRSRHQSPRKHFHGRKTRQAPRR